MAKVSKPLHTNGPIAKQSTYTVSVTVVKVRSACTHTCISYCPEYAYRYVTAFHVYIATVGVNSTFEQDQSGSTLASFPGSPPAR